MASYLVGSHIRLGATFTVDGVASDPDTVTVKVAAPGSETTATPTRVSAGVYTYTYTTVKAGTHYYGFEGVGTVEAVSEAQFYVLPTNL